MNNIDRILANAAEGIRHFHALAAELGIAPKDTTREYHRPALVESR